MTRTKRDEVVPVVGVGALRCGRMIGRRESMVDGRARSASRPEASVALARGSNALEHRVSVNLDDVEPFTRVSTWSLLVGLAVEAYVLEILSGTCKQSNALKADAFSTKSLRMS